MDHFEGCTTAHQNWEMTAPSPANHVDWTIHEGHFKTPYAFTNPHSDRQFHPPKDIHKGLLKHPNSFTNPHFEKQFHPPRPASTAGCHNWTQSAFSRLSPELTANEVQFSRRCATPIVERFQYSVPEKLPDRVVHEFRRESPLYWTKTYPDYEPPKQECYFEDQQRSCPSAPLAFQFQKGEGFVRKNFQAPKLMPSRTSWTAGQGIIQKPQQKRGNVAQSLSHKPPASYTACITDEQKEEVRKAKEMRAARFANSEPVVAASGHTVKLLNKRHRDINRPNVPPTSQTMDLNIVKLEVTSTASRSVEVPLGTDVAERHGESKVLATNRDAAVTQSSAAKPPIFPAVDAAVTLSSAAKEPIFPSVDAAVAQTSAAKELVFSVVDAAKNQDAAVTQSSATEELTAVASPQHQKRENGDSQGRSEATDQDVIIVHSSAAQETIVPAIVASHNEHQEHVCSSTELAPATLDNDLKNRRAARNASKELEILHSSCVHKLDRYKLMLASCNQERLKYFELSKTLKAEVEKNIYIRTKSKLELSRQLRDAKENISELSKKSEENRLTILDLETSLATERARLAYKEEECMKANEDLESEKTVFFLTKANLEEELDSLKEIISSDAGVSKAKCEIDHIKKKLDDQRDEFNKEREMLMAELSGYKHTIFEITGSLNHIDIHAFFKSLQSKLRRKENTLAECLTKLHHFEMGYSELSKEIAALNSENQTLRDEVLSLRTTEADKTDNPGKRSSISQSKRQSDHLDNLALSDRMLPLKTAQAMKQNPSKSEKQSGHSENPAVRDEGLQSSVVDKPERRITRKTGADNSGKRSSVSQSENRSDQNLYANKRAKQT